jgi:nitrate reductase NapE component
MAKAIELEMAVNDMQVLEKSIADLFFSANEVELFRRIKARASQITSAQIQEERREREAAKRKKAELDEVIEIVLFSIVALALVGTVGYFVYEAIAQCQGRCSFQK